MRVRPRHRTAAAVQTGIVALLVAAAVVGAGYGGQRLLLRPPTQGELTAARVAGALLRYRYVRSIIRIAGEPVRRAECLEGWEPKRSGRPGGRGARVLFSDGERLLLGDRRVLRLTPSRRPARMSPIAEVELAGCARSLTNHIYARLVANRRTHAVPADFQGHDALSLHVRTKRDQFDVFVDPHSLAPLGLRVETAHAVGWSVVEPVRPLTPALKQDFLRRFDG